MVSLQEEQYEVYEVTIGLARNPLQTSRHVKDHPIFCRLYAVLFLVLHS